ncbi:MAG TPA: hypothetical protein VG672_05515, partial [Bryobacteraceae bacterium]|nr:hypothetical protein [Bryobacteraceae bacterium]
DVDWSPDSRSLLFTAQSQGVWRLWRAMAGRPNPRWEPVEASEEVSQLSIARTRGILVSSSGHPDPSIWRGKLAGDGTAVTWGRFIDSKADDIFPGFSRDGRRVVFLSTRTGARQLWVKEETGEERELTRAPQRPSYASWTTAEDLVYSDLRERRMYLFRAGSPSPAPIPLVGTVGSHTTVSPDGQTVYWVKRFYIYQAPARGGSATLLTDEGGFPLRITGDGQWIYYSRHRFSNEIWRVHTKTRRAERVSDRLRPGCWACWAANATDLVYVAAGSAREPATLERKNLATGVVRSLGELPGRLPELGAPMVALSPDGRTVLVGIGEPGQGALRVYTQLPWMAAGGRN